MLTGKTLDDFVTWYNKEFIPASSQFGIALFWCMKPEMQQGVLLAFFRDKGIEIEIYRGFDFIEGVRLKTFNADITTVIKKYIYEDEMKDLPDYNTAFNEAIKKAVELYNLTNKEK